MVQIGHQHCILVARHALAAAAIGLNETENPLGFILRSQQQLSLEGEARYCTPNSDLTGLARRCGVPTTYLRYDG
jgi:hypothetical protein